MEDLTRCDPGCSTGLWITPALVVRLRIALLGALGIVVEDLGSLLLEIEFESERPHQPDLANRCAAYHKLVEAIQASYELQETVGLPGDVLGGRLVVVRGRAQQELVRQALCEDRAAARLALQDAHEMSTDVRRDVVQRISEITAFLGDGRPG